MLDKEIRRSQNVMRLPIATDEDHLPFEEICATVEDRKDFLGSDHTLRHCRDLWTSPLFLTASPDPKGWAGDENAILDRCDAMWRENLKRYEPPQWPEEKIKALDAVLTQAKREFGVP
jgi:trimethylamine:corrinoid methyltransferase-like protein